MIYAAHTSDEQKTSDFIASYYGPSDEPLPEYLSTIFAAAGIDPAARRAQMKTELAPYAFDLLSAIYRQIVQQCEDAGVLPIWVLVPRTTNVAPDQEFDSSVSRLAEIASDAGFLVFDLSHTFYGRDRTELRVARWDSHPNPAGHRLLADALYNMLVENADLLGMTR